MSLKIKKSEISIRSSIIFIVIASLLVMGMMFFLSPGSFMAFIKLLIEQPLLFLLNYVPILILMLILYFTSGNSIFSIVVSALIFTGGSFANRIKINLRQDPVVPSDLAVLTEV